MSNASIDVQSPEFIEAVKLATIQAIQSPEFSHAMFASHMSFACHPDVRGYDLMGICSRVGKGTQIQLMMEYQELYRTGKSLPTFDNIGFRCFSQFDEDGILLYILSLIGIKSRKSVEICAGVGHECNTANLVVNHGFHGLMVDGNPKNVEVAMTFYNMRPDTFLCPPKFIHAWIEAETANDLVAGHGFVGEIDVFSLDLDGIDYWVWDALTCIDPRIVVVEYHSAWGADEARTVPNVKGFCYSDEKGAYCGASLAAFNQLANQKGYRLVGCNRNRLNAFFVKRGLADDALPEVSVASCLDHYRLNESRERIRAVILQQDWVTV